MLRWSNHLILVKSHSLCAFCAAPKLAATNASRHRYLDAEPNEKAPADADLSGFSGFACLVFGKGY